MLFGVGIQTSGSGEFGFRFHGEGNQGFVIGFRASGLPSLKPFSSRPPILKPPTPP